MLVVLAGAPAGAVGQMPRAPATISVTSSVQIAFPFSMTFSVNAQSDVNVVDLRLHYTVKRQNLAKVVSEGWAQFAPAPIVSSQWVWDMRMSGLPPSAQVEYWWTARDAAGKTGQTQHQTVAFDDTRHGTQRLQKLREPVTTFAQHEKYLDVAAQEPVIAHDVLLKEPSMLKRVPRVLDVGLAVGRVDSAVRHVRAQALPIARDDARP